MSDDSEYPQDGEAASEGWTRRFTAFGNRLSEAVELYRQLGYEVRLEPAHVPQEPHAEGTGCASCFVMAHARTICTRPQAANRGQEHVESPATQEE